MIYVFEVEILPGYTADQYADAWVRASELIQQAPGARGTRLHRRIDDPHRLLAIASWDSKDSRDAMESRPGDDIRSIIESQAPYVRIRTIGEFDDPEWVVMPSS